MVFSLVRRVVGITRGCLNLSKVDHLRPVRNGVTVKYVAVEARMPSPSPIPGVVLRNLDSRTQLAHECVLVRINDNANVPAPDDEIAGKWISNTAERVHSVVKVARRGVIVRKSCARVDVMDQMRTVEMGPA